MSTPLASPTSAPGTSLGTQLRAWGRCQETPPRPIHSPEAARVTTGGRVTFLRLPGCSRRQSGLGALTWFPGHPHAKEKVVPGACGGLNLQAGSQGPHQDPRAQHTPFFGCLQAGWGPIRQDLAATVSCLSTDPSILCFLPDDSCPGWDPPSHLCRPAVLASHSFAGSPLVTPGPFSCC